MGLKNWISGVLTSSDTKVSASRFVEAKGVTVEEDMEGWRKLSDTAERDLNPMTQKRMQELAVYLWKTNPLANRRLNCRWPIYWLKVFASRFPMKRRKPGSTLSGATRSIAWISNCPRRCVNCHFMASSAGQPLSMKPTGMCGWVIWIRDRLKRSSQIPDNIEQPIGIVTVRNRHGVKRRYRIIVNGPEDVFTERTRQIRESFSDCDCFYFPVNNLSNATRGHSDLLAQMDWLDAYDHALFGEVERWDFLRAFIYDVTLKGATPEEVEKRASQIAPPKPGSVRVHNDSEQWEALAPSLGSYESESNARLFRNHIMGGQTIPEHWFGGGGDVNRATAGEMGEPTFKVFNMRQSYLGYILEKSGRLLSANV